MNKEKVLTELDALHELVSTQERMPCTAAGVLRAMEVIEQIPADDQWIPVTERLPEENQNVWVTNESCAGARYIEESVFKEREFEYALSRYRGITFTKLVKAWLPRFIPEPYKEES